MNNKWGQCTVFAKLETTVLCPHLLLKASIDSDAFDPFPALINLDSDVR